MRIIFITGNEHKLKEARQILSPEHEIIEENIDVSEIQSLDPKEIITAKLHAAQAQTKYKDNAIIVEDVSLWIGTSGLPGPLIKWFNKTIGRMGLYEFSQVFGSDAIAECNIGLLLPHHKKPEFFSGKIKGTIVSPRGESGFGFDPVFEPIGYNNTFAEMSAEEKNNISHRKLALLALHKHLNKLK